VQRSRDCSDAPVALSSAHTGLTAASAQSRTLDLDLVMRRCHRNRGEARVATALLALVVQTSTSGELLLLHAVYMFPLSLLHWLQDPQACCTMPVNVHAPDLPPRSLCGLVWQGLTQRFALAIAARACLAVWPHLTRNITPSHTHHDECTMHHQLTKYALHQLSHAPSQCTSTVHTIVHSLHANQLLVSIVS